MLHEMDETEEKTHEKPLDFITAEKSLICSQTESPKNKVSSSEKEPKRRALEVISPASSVEKASNKKKP